MLGTRAEGKMGGGKGSKTTTQRRGASGRRQSAEIKRPDHLHDYWHHMHVDCNHRRRQNYFMW